MNVTTQYTVLLTLTFQFDFMLNILIEKNSIINSNNSSILIE